MAEKTALTKIAVGVIVLAVAITAYFYVRPGGVKTETVPTQDYRKIESRVALNEAQIKELVKPTHPTIAIGRALVGGVWQAQTDKTSSAPAEKLGLLFSEAQSPEVAAPVYLCEFTVNKQKNLAFDSRANCSGEGHPVETKPLGFISEKIRTGFLLFVRCKSEAGGFYNSLNVRCESPKDRLQVVLGAIRAAE